MHMNSKDPWNRFQTRFIEFPSAGLAIDVSRMNFADDFVTSKQSLVDAALGEMKAVENGDFINTDENRMVGHYWLRNPELATDKSISDDIVKVTGDVKQFAHSIHSRSLRGQNGPFKNLLVIGIGGSALGPQFVAHALGHPTSDKLKLFFFDNTDPDGMDRVLELLSGQLGQTLCLVISKSGGTKETRNGMLEAQAAYDKAQVSFARHAVAITGEGSQLDVVAESQKWLGRFPMWDWVGGRTSVTSVVGLLPAALQGIDIDEFLRGAKACDETTRNSKVWFNPALILAISWFYIGKGKGERDMVILPYKDRLELFSRYLQQLVMESLGKEKDRNGKVVHQGLTVYGNKGSTDQHAYIQQLSDGLQNFFVTFLEVLHDRNGASLCVENATTSGDYLFGFFMGTRQALYENHRESITITLDKVSSFHVGSLIALFERAVGLYAGMIGVNAYHQPGVEAGKKAAGNVIELQNSILGFLQSVPGQRLTADDIATGIGQPDAAETIFKICRHLAANSQKGISLELGRAPRDTTFMA